MGYHRDMPVPFERLGTERANPRSRALDRMSAREIVALMNREDRAVIAAVGRELTRIAAAVDVIVASLARGGRLVFVGAGTSGRLGVLEAAECPPTFGTPPGMVQAIMAGGRASVFRSREGAEDDAAAAQRAVRKRVRAGDVVVGISASGVTPFVRGALREARQLRAATILVVCNRATLARAIARVIIAPLPGPEVLAGSTRLKAGTATKLVLNMLTTGAMTRLGRVYGNRMIDVQPRSRKLRARAERLVAELARVSRPRARVALAAAGGRVRLALVIARTGMSPRDAARALLVSGGAVRPYLTGGSR
jgi:N-acetylmuramic acid 6-phosphate etherase